MGKKVIFILVSALVLFTLLFLRWTFERSDANDKPPATKVPQAAQFFGKRPVVIQFLCRDCDSCKTMTSEIEKLGRELNQEVEVRIVEDGCECSSALKTRYGVRDLPATILVDPSGAELWRSQGVVDYADLSSAIDQTIFKNLETCSPKKDLCE